MIKLISISLFILQIVSLQIWSDRPSYRSGTNYIGQIPQLQQQKCTNSSPNTQQSSTQLASTLNKVTCLPPRFLNPNNSQCECLFETNYYPQTNQCLCPIDKPLWTGNGCIACDISGGVNQNTVQCISCPEGFVVNQENGRAFCRPVV